MNYVEEATEGKVTFERYFSGALIPATEAITAIESGLVDVAYAGPTFFPGELPLNNWLTGLGAGASADNATFGHIQNMLSAYELIQEYPEFEDEYNSLGLHPLAPFSQQQTGIECTSPVTTLNDAAGKRISSTGTWASEMQALGFETTYLPFVDIYEALQRGVLDCFIVPAGAVYAAKHYEVAPYFTPLYARAAFSLVRPVMSLERWESLPESIQTIFDEAEVAALEEFLEKDMAANATMVADPNGFEILQAPELDDRLTQVREESLEAMVANAPEGISDPQGIVNRYGEIRAEWNDTLLRLGAEPVALSDWVEGIAAGPQQPLSEAFAELRERQGMS